MDDLQFGMRDKRGNWRPNEAIGPAPVFVWPWSLGKFVRWLPHYFLPWNALFFAVASVFWFFLTPARDTLQTLGWGWALYLLARNSAVVILLYGAKLRHLPASSRAFFKVTSCVEPRPISRRRP